MYFGSIRFFKHFIISTICLLIIVPISVSTALSVKASALKTDYDLLEAFTSEELLQASSEKDKASLKLSALQKEVDILEARLNEIRTKIHIDSEPVGYQELYPDMYVTPTEKVEADDEKIVYLTFDDGPSPNTVKVLDILDEHDIKATFFVIHKKDAFSNEVYQDIVDRGHTLAVHSSSHDYKKIYQSAENFLADFNEIFTHLYNVTGEKPTLFRFPGGSINGYNDGIYYEIIAEMSRRGFTYHDWNVSAQDASSKATANSIYHMVADEAAKRTKSIVLMHDSQGKAATVESLPKIIEDLTARGYSFDKLDASVKPFIFSYIKPN